MLQTMDADNLKLLQKILLAMLLEVDAICRRHDIKYFLAGGTLLGAIRHHGFIPWDDDGDIMMLRRDYEKFQQVAPAELPDALYLQMPDYNPYTRIRVNDTVFASEFMMRHEKEHSGIFLDIFCHDRTGAHPAAQSLHRMATRATRSIVFNKWGGTDIQGDGSHAALRWIGSRVQKIIPMKTAVLLRDRTLTAFRDKNTRCLYDGMGANMARGAFPEELLLEAVCVDFEGYPLPVPKEYDRYLTWLYGDYMTLPPKEQQKPGHETVQIDFGIYQEPAKKNVPADQLFSQG